MKSFYKDSMEPLEFCCVHEIEWSVGSGDGEQVGEREGRRQDPPRKVEGDRVRGGVLKPGKTFVMKSRQMEPFS